MTHRGRLTAWLNRQLPPIVIVGGGLAAGTVVTELREGGYDGPLAVYTDEAHPPYERPPLSKDFLLDKGPLDAALVHPEDWYAEHRVDLHTSTPVTAIDPAHHQLTAAGATSSYSTLVLATGSRARHLPLADDSGAEVHYLRQWDDAERLRAALTEGSRLAHHRRRLDRPRGRQRRPQARRRGRHPRDGAPAPARRAGRRGRRAVRRPAPCPRRRPAHEREDRRHPRRPATGAEIEVDGDVVTVDRLSSASARSPT